MRRITQQERAIKIERSILKNKLYILICIIVIAFLAVTALTKDNSNDVVSINTENSDTVEVDNDDLDKTSFVDGMAATSGKVLKWKFYPIDAWILGVGGAFCTVMIIKERRKAKEDFN